MYSSFKASSSQPDNQNLTVERCRVFALDLELIECFLFTSSPSSAHFFFLLTLPFLNLFTLFSGLSHYAQILIFLQFIHPSIPSSTHLSFQNVLSTYYASKAKETKVSKTSPLLKIHSGREKRHILHSLQSVMTRFLAEARTMCDETLDKRVTQSDQEDRGGFRTDL